MKKRWIVFCAAALFAAGCASALDEAKAAPKTAVEKIRQLRETVDFNHAVRAQSMIDFSRGAFAGKIEKVLVNGKPNRWYRNGVTVSLRPENGWREGLNEVTVRADGRDYTMYVSHYKYIPTVGDYSNEISLVNGKPFTPLAIFAVDIRQIRDAAKFGFNVFHNYTMTRMEDQYPMKEFLDAVHSVNGYAMIHLQHLRIAASDYKPVMERVVKYMNHPATYWWYLFDEPGIFGVDVEQLTFFNDMIRKLDPYHNVVSSSWYQGKFQDSVDVDIPQWYHGHAAGMAKTSSEYRRNAAEQWHNMQYLPILNTHDSAFGIESQGSLNPNSFYDEVVNGKKRGDYPKDSPEYQDAERRALSVVNNLDKPFKKPTATYPGSIERMRGQVAVSILSGANGLIYWLYSDQKLNPRWGIYTVFNPKKNRAEFTRTMKEVKAFAPYFNGFTHGAQLKREGNLWYGFKKVDGKSILILVNVSKQPVSGTLELPGAPSVLYRDNETPVRLNGGKLDYSLAPDEGRFYASEILKR